MQPALGGDRVEPLRPTPLERPFATPIIRHRLKMSKKLLALQPQLRFVLHLAGIWRGREGRPSQRRDTGGAPIGSFGRMKHVFAVGPTRS